MRSVAVVLPASMWAMMPMLRTLSSCSGFGMLEDAWVSTTVTGSPPVMREGLVGLRHAVDVVLLLERAALLVRRVEDLADELVDHLPLAALPRGRDQPADRERAGAARRHLDGHLVVRATDAAAADLEDRGHGLEGLLQLLG